MLLILESAGRRYYVPLSFKPFAISCLPIKVFISLFLPSSSSKRPLAVVLSKRLLYGPILFQSESRIRFIVIISDATISHINEAVHRCRISRIFLVLLEEIFFLTFRPYFILLLRCYTMWFDRLAPPFRASLLPPSSGSFSCGWRILWLWFLEADVGLVPM
jgi:hypothetical protein